MKTVKALVAFSNGVISMEQYEVRELPTDMANDLIAAGICVEAGGGSDGGVLVVTATVEETTGEPTTTLDKTWQEIHDADFAVIKSISGTNIDTNFVNYAQYEEGSGNYTVGASNRTVYTTESANGYPSYTGK